jgi:hypothetical protein
MPTPTIPNGALYMNATLLTGTGATQVITNGVAGQSFQPDMVWLKSRTNANNPTLYDSIRGVNNVLYPNLTNAQASGSNQLTSFNSNGFTLGASENANDQAGELSVGWNWLAGGAAVSNTSGTITSQVSANTTSGFSVVNASLSSSFNGITLGHGLGVVPAMIIGKPLISGTNWYVYNQNIGATKALYLNDTTASITQSGVWNNTSPTSSVFSLGTASWWTGSLASNYIFYCWAPIAGYSAFGSYTGNGSTDGPFVYLGFRPRYIMYKISSGSTGSWYVYDTARNTYNTCETILYPNLSNAEAVSPSSDIDILSNGFKLRDTNGDLNGNGYTYIYAAFAENPFKYANAR